MIYLVMFVKTFAWVTAFWLGIRRGRNEMLLCAAGVSLFLTLVDDFIITDPQRASVLALSLVLYSLMSFFLMPVAWKVRNAAVSVACYVAGSYGAYAIVHFWVEYLGGAYAS